MFNISFSGKTDIGRKRKNNEDAFVAQYIWDNNHALCVVIDGVGGYEGGEVAAEIAQKTIVEYLEKYTNGERLDLLKQAVVEANNEIVKQGDIQRQFANMSCVLTACLIQTEKKLINMVHVGDTRLYQYHAGKLKKLSHDHSLVGYREEIGNLTEDEAMKHPQRNIIERSVGDVLHQIDDENFLEAAAFPLLPNSTLLLCSDGLCDMLKSMEMVSVLRKEISLEEKVQDLIDFANDKGGKDNITVVLAEVIPDDPKVAQKTETKNSFCDFSKEEITVEHYNKEERKPAKKEKKIFTDFLIGCAGILLLVTAAAGGRFLHGYCRTGNFGIFQNIIFNDSIQNNFNDSISSFQEIINEMSPGTPEK